MCLLLLISLKAVGQVSERIRPKSFLFGINKFANARSSNDKGYALPNLDNSVELEKANKFKKENCPQCRVDYYGKAINVAIDIKKEGTLVKIPEGNIWFLSVYSGTAKALQFYFDEFKLPDKATLHIYNDNMDYILGAFTKKNMNPSGKFVTRIFPESRATIEYFEPTAAISEGKVSINKVVHVLKDLNNYDYDASVTRDGNGKGFKAGGSCTVDINCPAGLEVANESLAIALLSHTDDRTGYAGFCTGELVNSTSSSDFKKPYLLTAAHPFIPCMGCIPSIPDEYYDLIAYFHYQNSGCENDFVNPLSSANAFSGAYLRSFGDEYTSNGKVDYALFELTENPKDYIQVAYLGWDCRNTAQIGPCYNISHPWADAKKVAIATGDPSLVPHLTAPNISINFTAWQLSWDVGVTQPVSSGSPLFNASKRVIGTLYGGTSRCADNPPDFYGNTAASPGPDWFGRMDYAWNNPNPNFQALKYYLDPAVIGALFTDTYVPPAPGDDGSGGNTTTCYAYRRAGDPASIKLAPIPLNNQMFGKDVAVSGDYIIVGAPGERKVYVYKKEGCSVNLKAQFTGDDSYGQFGWSVDIDGDNLIVGDPGTGMSAGYAYVYKRSGESWLSTAKLSSGLANFGYAVSIFQDNILIGSPLETVGASQTGAVYFYKRNATSNVWEFNFRDYGEADLARFGSAVDIKQLHAVVGAPGVSNKVYIYQYKYLNGSYIWGPTVSYSSSLPDTQNFFGENVEMSEDGMDIIASGGGVFCIQMVNGTWTNKGQLTDPMGTSEGLRWGSISISNGYAIFGTLGSYVYIYQKNSSGNWSFIKQIVNNYDMLAEDNFASSVALSDKIFIAGAPYQNSYYTKCNYPGAAYVYDLFGAINDNAVSVCNKSITGTQSDVNAGTITIGGTSCNVTYASGAKINYTANRSIDMLPGTQIKNGSTFSANTSGCPNFNNGYLNNGRESNEVTPVTSVDTPHEPIKGDATLQEHAYTDQLISVYPNPSSNGSFNIESFAEIADLKIYNLQGQVIENVEANYITERRVEVNMGSGYKGIFMLTLRVNNKTFISKIVLK